MSGQDRHGPVAQGIIARHADAGGQDELLAREDVERPVRRTERAVAASVHAAGLGDLDGGLGALAVELAAAVDVAARRLDPYGVAAAARELRETLTRLRLDPSAREDDGDELAQLLGDLGPS